MNVVREAMIVAGGRGTRLAPLTEDTPKPLLPLVGWPFLRGVIRRLATVGVERVLLVVGPDPAPFLTLREDAAAVGVTVEPVPESSPLDTAGGVRSALDRVTGTFLVLNGDILTGLDLPALIAEHADLGAVATLALTRVDDTSAYGVCVRDGRRIVDFVEKPAPGTLPGQDCVNAGTYVLEPAALRRFPEGRLSFERQVFPDLVADGAVVGGMVSEAAWTDLGTPQRYLEGHRLVLDGEVAWPTVSRGTRRHVGDDVEVADSATIEEPVWIGAGSRIGAETCIGAYTVIGAGCTLGRGVDVSGAVLHDGVEVGDGAQVIQAVIGRCSRIGTVARIAPRALIGARQTLPAGELVGEDARRPPAR
jgi:mannose-1-phosphate guanylyltransferase